MPEMLSKKDSLVVFNAESERSDDLMNDKEQITSLQITINDCLKERRAERPSVFKPVCAMASMQ